MRIDLPQKSPGSAFQHLLHAPAGVFAIASRYNSGYTEHVKTAISIPDAVFEEAERLAKERGVSRSELYAEAVAEYVKGQRFAGVRERLDAVYESAPDESDLDPLIERAQSASLPKEEW